MRDLWEYISENWRLSLRFWEDANVSFAAIGAIIALPLTVLVAAGWEIIWSDFALRVLVLFPGMFLLVMLLLVTPFRMWASQKRKIEGLTSKPERISFVDLAALAEVDYGWTFGNDSFESLDFVRALRQAAHDECIAIEGRRGCTDKTEVMKDWYVLEAVPLDHLKDYHFDVPGFFHGTNNYDVSTRSYALNTTDAERFRDLHVANKHRAVAWLQNHAAACKGRAEAAAQLETEGRKKWEAEMREQGFEFIGDANSEQGRRAIKRSDFDQTRNRF